MEVILINRFYIKVLILFKKKILPLSFFCFSFFAIGQTKVSGRVYDTYAQPVAFANILFKNSTEGTITSDDGTFSLESNENYETLIVSYMGFKTKEIKILLNGVKNLKIILEEEGVSLGEIVVINKPKKALSKKENPAYKILKKIWANKTINNFKAPNAYQYKKYTTTELSLSNLDQEFLKQTLKKDYDSVIKIIKQDKDQKNFKLPIYWQEKLHAVYGSNILKKERVDIEAEREFGVNDKGFGLERIGKAFSEIDIYKNTISIFDKSFVSPISSDGYSVYHYVLSDSIVDKNNISYTIHFFPKKEGDLAMEGKFVVTNKSYAITDINMRINNKINLNFIHNLYIEKKYALINKSHYLPISDSYECEFSIVAKKDKEKRLGLKKEISFFDYVLDAQKETTFYNRDVTQYKPNQFKKEENYWDKHIPKNINVIGTKRIITDLKSNKRIKHITGIINTVSSGYINIFDQIQLGSLWTTFAINDIEGLRLRAGFRNFSSADDRFRTNTYIAYGTKDKNVKYGAEVKYLLTYKPRIIVGASYMNDYEQIGSRFLQEIDLLPYNFGNISLFARGENYTLSHTKRSSFVTDLAITKNLHIGVSGVHQNINTIMPNMFTISYKDILNNIQTSVKDFNTNISVIYSPKRNVFGYGVEQKYGKNLYAKTILKYGRGIKGIGGSNFNYDKLQFSHNQPFKIGKYGILKTNLELGKTFGTLPLPLLSPVVANQTYSLVSNTFSLLDYYDFVTDTYAAGHFEHHFEGFIINRIPLLKKTKLRLLSFFNGIYGDLSAKNYAINASTINYNTPKKVYYEYGFGFENIGYGNIRPLRIDFIWRSNFNDINGTKTPKFGVRININPKF